MLKKSLWSLFVGLILNIAISNAKVVQRIVGGSLAPEGKFKHQVSLQIIFQNRCTRHFCGGSILDDVHIITAAHCVYDKYFRKIKNLRITVMAGTTNLRNTSSGIYRDVEYTIIPTSFKFNSVVDDIAILRLKRPLPLKSESHRIRAINLPRDDYRYKPPNIQVAIVSGFGVYKQKWNPQNGKIELGTYSLRLKFATGLINKIEPQFGCRDTEVCVLNDNSHGACNGDSGGPLIDESTNTLIGIVSYSDHEWCGKTTKYTRVSSYLDFIGKVRAGRWVYPNGDINVHQQDQDFKHEQIMQKYPHCNQLYKN